MEIFLFLLVSIGWAVCSYKTYNVHTHKDCFDEETKSDYSKR